MGLLKEFLSKSLDLFYSSFKKKKTISLQCCFHLLSHRMTRLNFRFPYADQFVERYAKPTREFIQLALAANQASDRWFVLILLRIE